MRAVIYCRVSTQEQVENLSLRTQEDRCREYCNRQGFEVDRVFVEEGESAKTADRTQLQAMLRYCQQNKNQIHALVVYAINRFARNSADHHALSALFKKLGINLRSVTEPIGESASGKLMEGVLASFAEFDNTIRGERSVLGMQTALASGRWTHQPPIGYRKPAPGKQAPSLEPDPDTAPLITRAFQLMATGDYKKREVLDAVTASGLRTRKDKPLSKQSFSKLLRNPIYKGRVVVPKWSIDERGDFEPIVSDETFAAVQAISEGRRPRVEERHRDHPDFPLRRFVRCEKCGTPLTGSWSTGRKGRRYGYYRCPRTACGIKTPRDALEKKFLAALRAVGVRPGVMRLFDAIVRDVWKERHRVILDHQESLRKKLKDLEDRQDQLVEAHIYKRKIDEETYSRQTKKLRSESDGIRLQMSEIETSPMDIDATLHFARSLLTDPAGLWTNAKPGQRPRLQQAVFPNGLRFDGDLNGTAETSLAFNYLAEIQTRKSEVACDAVVARLTDQPPIVWATDILAVDSEERHAYIEALRQADAHDFQPLTDYLMALNPGVTNG